MFTSRFWVGWEHACVLVSFLQYLCRHQCWVWLLTMASKGSFDGTRTHAHSHFSIKLFNQSWIWLLIEQLFSDAISPANIRLAPSSELRQRRLRLASCATALIRELVRHSFLNQLGLENCENPFTVKEPATRIKQTKRRGSDPQRLSEWHLSFY